MARLAILSSEPSEEGNDEEMDEHNSEAGTVSTGDEATPRNTIGTAVENEYKKCASVQVERNDVQTENIAATVEKVLEDRLLRLQSATIANGARIFKSTVDDLQSLSSSIKSKLPSDLCSTCWSRYRHLLILFISSRHNPYYLAVCSNISLS
jgi:hypothetical protein